MADAARQYAFAELHAISNYSFLRGASHPEELVHTACALGYEAIAITDECSVAGAVKAHLAAQESSIKLIIGAEFHVAEAGSDVHLVLLAPTRNAYGQLSELITVGRRRSPKGEYTLSLDDFRGTVKDCLALWIPSRVPFAHNLAIGKKIKQLLPNLWIALELFLRSRRPRQNRPRPHPLRPPGSAPGGQHARPERYPCTTCWPQCA